MISTENHSALSDVLSFVWQAVGSEDRRRTLTPLALRERYSALNEPVMGTVYTLTYSQSIHE